MGNGNGVKEQVRKILQVLRIMYPACCEHGNRSRIDITWGRKGGKGQLLFKGNGSVFLSNGKCLKFFLPLAA